MVLNDYFKLSATAVLVGRPGHPPHPTTLCTGP